MLSRADRRSFTPKRVDLSLIAEEATETLFALAEERGVTLETAAHMAPTVGSEALLLQLATNLVRNGIIHNLPEHGTSGSRPTPNPRTMRIQVESTGAPLTTQLVSTLTEPFQRGSERIRSDHAGVGLGLAIVERITQAHEGTLAADRPRDAGGLCVTVRLPAAAPEPAS